MTSKFVITRQRFLPFVVCVMSCLIGGALTSGEESAATVQKQVTVTCPASALWLPLRLELPQGMAAFSGQTIQTAVQNHQLPGKDFFAEVCDGPAQTGDSLRGRYLMIGVRPPANAVGQKTTDTGRRAPAEGTPQESGGTPTVSLAVILQERRDLQGPSGGFRWEKTSDATMTLLDAKAQPVLAYNFGPITNPNVPEKDSRRTRACYVHPVWGLRGEVLTDDFPKDHYHHHGIFWTWPHVVVGDKEYSLWDDRGELRQKFVKWLSQAASTHVAVLGVENGWFRGEEKVLTERVWLTVYEAGPSDRFIDLDLFLLPQMPVTLWGAEGKSYGGLTMRFRPPSQRDAIITVPDGVTKDDLYETRLPWADFTSRFGEGDALSGGTIMVAKDHPDYPPTWLTRHYGPLCVGWPGIQSRTLEPPGCVRLSYRIWIHDGQRTTEQIQAVYDSYLTAFEARCHVPAGK